MNGLDGSYRRFAPLTGAVQDALLGGAEEQVALALVGFESEGLFGELGWEWRACGRCGWELRVGRRSLKVSIGSGLGGVGGMASGGVSPRLGLTWRHGSRQKTIGYPTLIGLVFGHLELNLALGCLGFLGYFMFF